MKFRCFNFIAALVMLASLWFGWLAAVDRRQLTASRNEIQRLVRQMNSISNSSMKIVPDPGSIQTGASAAKSAPAARSMTEARRLTALHINGYRADAFLNYAAFSRQHNLSRQQAIALDHVIAAHSAANDDIGQTARAFGLSKFDSAIATIQAEEDTAYQIALREILGPAGAKDLQTFDDESNLRDGADRMTQALSGTSNALSTDQEDRLVAIFEQLRSSGPNSEGPPGVDWDQAATEARKFLTPAQMAEFPEAVAIARRGETNARIVDQFERWQSTTAPRP